MFKEKTRYETYLFLKQEIQKYEKQYNMSIEEFCRKYDDPLNDSISHQIPNADDWRLVYEQVLDMEKAMSIDKLITQIKEEFILAKIQSDWDLLISGIEQLQSEEHNEALHNLQIAIPSLLEAIRKIMVINANYDEYINDIEDAYESGERHMLEHIQSILREINTGTNNE
jgi:hypothetical protein